MSDSFITNKGIMELVRNITDGKRSKYVHVISMVHALHEIEDASYACAPTAHIILPSYTANVLLHTSATMRPILKMMRKRPRKKRMSMNNYNG